MNAHTPWRVIERFDGDESLGVIIQAGDEIIASVPGIGQHDFDNARLIAAAPDLLAVLQEILNDHANCELGEQMRLKALAIVAKATGGEA